MKRFSHPKEGSRERGGTPSQRALPTSSQLAIRLVMAFSIIVILLIAVGDLGLRRMGQINHDLQVETGRQWTKLRLAREATIYSNHNSRITMEIVLLANEEEIRTLRAARVENSDRISLLLSQLASLCESEQEKKELNGVIEARARYVDSYQNALHLLLIGKGRAAALDVMARETTPALLKYQAAWDDFLRFEGDQLEHVTLRSAALYAEARRLVALMSLGAVMIAGVIAMLVLRRVLRESTGRLHEEQNALRTAHREAEIFINAVPSILVGVDHDSRITRWNVGAEAAFGLSRAEVIGKPLADCGVEWQAPHMREEIEYWGAAAKSLRRDQVPFQIRGEPRLLGLTITPIDVSDENATKILVIGSDITDRSLMEDQLRQAQKLESVGHLASGIAHEINTPTQYIGDNVHFLKEAFQGLSSLLATYGRLLKAARSGDLSPETVQAIASEVEQTEEAYLVAEIPKAIEQTLEGISRVSTLVNAMKEFSHPGTKETILLDLNHAIQSTITVARNEWKYVAEMETDFDPKLPLIWCQPGEFNQVILNLIVNATHAIADVVGKGETKKGKILVQTRNTAEYAEIRIQDTGTGIPEKVRARIFDPFFTTKEIGKGTGQGLAIAHSVVVDKLAGSIQFETEVGKGTTFIIRLPHGELALAAKNVS